MTFAEHPLVTTAVLCLAMLLCSGIGFFAGKRRLSRAARDEQFGVVEAAVLALLGLLLGFTLQSSMARLSEARHLLVEEINAIGTAYLRVDLLAPSDQLEMRRLFHAYLEARLKVYDTVEAGQDPGPAIAQARLRQHEIWSKGVDSSRAEPGPTAILLLPALNQMIDVTTARSVSFQTKLPFLIVGLLFVVAIIGGLLIGYAMAVQKRQSAAPAIIFALIISATVYVLLDLDNQKAGFIRLVAAEQELRGLLDSIR
jgi:hypothetical protein